MSFYLVNNHEFFLNSEENLDLEGDYCSRTIKLPVSFEPTEQSTKSLSEKDCARLKNALDSIIMAPAPQLEDEQVEQFTDWTLNLKIGMACNSKTSKWDCLSLNAHKMDNVLVKLKCFLRKYKLKLMLTVKSIRLLITENAHNTAILVDIESFEAELDQLYSEHGVKLTVMSEAGPSDRKYWHPRSHCNYKGKITISGTLLSSVHRLSSVADEGNPSVCRKLLYGEVNSDTVIIAKDNERIKCHRAFLSAQSSVLQTVFSRENFEESRTGIVEMPNMTGSCVRAFLSHLYLQDDDRAKENCGMALELLQAGHQYDIPTLKQSMESILLDKPDDWYQVNVALKLFLFAKNLPQGEKLKNRSLQVLKKNFATLSTLPAYTQLFEDSPDIAKELCTDLVEF